MVVMLNMMMPIIGKMTMMRGVTHGDKTCVDGTENGSDNDDVGD